MYLVHRECYEHALNIFVKLFGPKDIRVAQVLVSLGNILENVGMEPEAIILYQEALAIEEVAIEEEIFGPNSLNVSYHFGFRILIYP